MQAVSSWGRLRQAPHDATRPAFLDQARLGAGGPPALCYGLGRSCGAKLDPALMSDFWRRVTAQAPAEAACARPGEHTGRAS